MIPVDPKLLRDLRLHLGSLNLSKLINTLEEHYSNESVMFDFGMLLRAIFYTVGFDSKILPPLQRLRSLMPTATQIYSSPRTRTVLVDFVSLQNFLTIRVPVLSKVDDCASESSCAMMATNEMRRIIPNFLYLFTSFTASPMYIREDKAVSWATHTEKTVTYLLYEKVGMALQDFIQHASVIEFMEVFLQILLALRTANLQCKFTHYQIKSDMISVRRLNTPISIAYATPEGQKYLTTNSLALITPSPVAYFKKDNIEYGTIKFINQRIHKADFLISDYFSLTLMMASLAVKLNKDDCLNQCRRMLTFFTKASLESVLSSSLAKMGYRANIDTMSDKSPDAYFSHIRRMCTTSFLNENNSHPFSCSNIPTNFLHEINAVNEMQESITPKEMHTLHPETFVDYYDCSMIESVKEKFDYFRAKEMFQEKYRHTISLITEELKISIPDLTKVPLVTLLKVSTLQIIQNVYLSVVHIYDLLKTLHVFEDVAMRVAKDFETQDSGFLDTIAHSRQVFTSEILPKVESINESMRLNSDILDKLIVRPEYLSSPLPDLKWYERERVDMSFAIPNAKVSSSPSKVDFALTS